MKNINFKLAVFLTCCSLNSAWAQKENTENLHFGIAEHVYIQLILKINTDIYNLFKKENSISKEELKRKEDMLLCTKMELEEDFNQFLKNSIYEASEKTIQYLELQEKNKGLEKNIKCEDHYEEGSIYLNELLNSISF